jgi:hypothetical protein
MLAARSIVDATKQLDGDEKTRGVTTEVAHASWLTPPQAAIALGVSLKRVRELMSAGRVEMRPRGFTPRRHPKLELRRESLEAALCGKTIPPLYSAPAAPESSALEGDVDSISGSRLEPAPIFANKRDVASQDAPVLPPMTSDLFLEAAAVVTQWARGAEGGSTAITEMLRRGLAQAAAVT